MADLSHRQQEMRLVDFAVNRAERDRQERLAIYKFLHSSPLSSDRAKAHYPLSVLVDVGLVEKTGDHPATYRAVER